MKCRLTWSGLRWLGMAALVLALAATPRQAQGQQSETNAFQAAQQSLRDANWPRAENEFAAFIKRFPQSALLAPAVLSEAEALRNQQKYQAVIDLLTAQLGSAGSLADEFIFWTAMAYDNLGKYQPAADAYARLIRENADSKRRLEAAFREADAYAKMRNWPVVIEKLGPTNGMFQQISLTNLDREFSQRGFLLLAEAQLAQTNYASATAALEVLAGQSLTPELEWRRQSLRASIQLASGQPDAALLSSTNLLDLAAGKPELKARSIVLIGEIRERLNQFPEAIRTYEANLADDTPIFWQRGTLLKIVSLNLKQNQTTEAAGRLKDYFARHATDDTNADFALLISGELQLKLAGQAGPGNAGVTNYLADARTNFDKLIKTYPNSDLAGKAYLDLGLCLWEQRRIPESQAAFSNAVSRLQSFPEDQATARFKLADALYLQTNYAAAITNYSAVIDQYRSFEPIRTNLFERAWYQIMRAAINETNLPVAGDALDKMSAEFPRGQLLDEALLLLGQARSNGRDYVGARSLFSRLIANSPDSDLASKAHLETADTYQHEGNWTNAISQYESWLVTYTNDAARLPDAEFRLALANSEAGLDTNAFMDFTNFVARFPADELTPSAQFWLGDYYMNRQDYQNAEVKYQEVYGHSNLPASELMFEARMMAGRAAMKRQSDDAITYFTGLVEAARHSDACPVSLRWSALYASGDAYFLSTAANHWNNAIEQFQAVANAATNDPFQVLAWGRLGDCYLALSNYDKASNYYQMVISSDLADFRSPKLVIGDQDYSGVVIRSSAECHLGLTLERRASANAPPDRDLLAQAMNRYENVVYGNNLRGNNEQSDPFWVEEAGKDAGRLAEELGMWEHAARLYDRLGTLFPSSPARFEDRKARAEKNLTTQKKTPG